MISPQESSFSIKHALKSAKKKKKKKNQFWIRNKFNNAFKIFRNHLENCPC